MTRKTRDLDTALAEMARDLLHQETPQQTLDRIVVHATELVTGCHAAGILVVRGAGVQTLAATNEVARASDRAQEEAGEGPCFDATWHREEVFRIADMTTNEKRWPRYAARARELGIGSMMGFMLFTEHENLGALDLYSSRADAFTEDSEHVGWLLASHAAVAFSSARHDSQLRQAITTRQDIGEAMGIIMERYKLTEEQAFAVLRKASQDTNVRLREVAATVAATGEIPGVR